MEILKDYKKYLILLIAMVLIVSFYYIFFYKDNREDYSINKPGNYELSGKYSCISIDTEGEVNLLLNDTDIKCEDTGIVINNTNIVNITLKGNNNIISSNEGISSTSDLSFNGNGELTIDTTGDSIKASNITIDKISLSIETNNDGIESKNDLIINSGNITIKTNENTTEEDISTKGLKAKNNINIKDANITIESFDDCMNADASLLISKSNISLNTKDDAIHADDDIEIESGNITIDECYEGLESGIVNIKGGNIVINASDDGINAVTKDNKKSNSDKHNRLSNGVVNISGGTINIISHADGIDCNGDINMTGGDVYLESYNIIPETALDHDGTFKITSGTLVVVARGKGSDDMGEKVSSVPMIIVNTSKTSGKVSFGDIKYTPEVTEYTHIIIASSKLEFNKTYRLKAGSFEKDIDTKNNIVLID